MKNSTYKYALSIFLSMFLITFFNVTASAENKICKNENCKDGVTLVVVDMLYDFIDGTLACTNAEEAVKSVVDFIGNNNIKEVYYITDAHPTTHCSFKDNGGTWPVHCVEGTKGGAIHSAFYSLKKAHLRPLESNIFRKGTNKNKEQYSGYKAVNSDNKKLRKLLKNKNIVVCGIATDFCVLNTVTDILKKENRVSVLKDGLAYVTLEGHNKAIDTMKEKGAIIK